MKTAKLSSRQALILAVSALTLASLACSAISPETPVPTQLPSLTTAAAAEETSKLPAKPSPTPALAQSSPSPASTAVPPADSATVAPLPPANWQPIPDLPRQINTLVVDPAAPQVLYAGTGSTGAGSGVYKSEDGGLTWQLASDGLPSEDVVALAFSHDDSPILYAAIGNSIFASADGGASWSQQAQRVGNERGFEQLRVAPGDGRVLYGVAVVEGAFRSDDGGHNWVTASEGLPRDGDVLNAQSLAVDPTGANVVYLGTGWGPFHGNGVYKSTDGGATWTPANQGMIDYSITALAVDPANPQIVYAGGFHGELFKSTDGGQTWNDLTDELPIQVGNHQTVQGIAIAPATPGTIYLLYDWVGVLVSNDGGASWRLLGKPGEPDHLPFTALAVIFDRQPVLLVGIRETGGWRYSADQPMPTPAATVPPADSATVAPTLPPGSWQPVPDLPRQVNTLVADPNDPQVLYAGTGATGAGSGVYKSEDGGLSWHLVSAGLPSEDVVALAFSRDDPPVLYAVVGTGEGDVFASTDGAESWTRLGDAGLTGFETRLVVAPSDGNVLFTVKDVRGVARSHDGGYTWLPIGEGLPKDESGDANVQSLAIDPTDASVIYLGTGWGPFHGNGVYKSMDGGATWAATNQGMIDYSITALAVDPTKPQIIYAGTFDGELFKSTDSGATWSDLSTNLPDQTSIIEIVLDPAAPQTVYLLCDRVGVLVSYDGGARWRLLGKPGEPDYPSFTAMAVTCSPQPVLVVGIRDEGGWRYATD